MTPVDRFAAVDRSRIVEAVQGEADVRTAYVAVAERGSACRAEAPLHPIRAREHTGRREPYHLIDRKADKRHERSAGGFLAHAAVTDAGAVARAPSTVADAAALTRAFEAHGH